jgi:hypothetical protein
MSQTNQLIIEAFEKGYRATPDGRIFSRKGKELKLCKGANGYLVFGIRSKSCGTKTIPAHRFVAYCKYGESALEAECVRHFNGNRDDLSYDNILIGSLSDNFNDNPEQWKIRFALSGANARRKLTLEQAKEAKAMLNSGSSMRAVAKKFGISKTSAQQIKEGKSYKWL